jgi:ubiquinone/menaquinone biosynthesis C-methylase UbiE
MPTPSPDYNGASYEKYRASYPKELAQKLFSLTGYQPPETILELGCGTGKGTEILIQEGARVHGIEPNKSMGEIAEAKFAKDRFSWSPCSFKDYQATGQTFPLITSAHAFHWIDQDIAFGKCYELLKPNGALAIYRNNRKYDDEFSRREHEIQVRINGCDPHGVWNENYYEAMAECVTEFIRRSAGRFHRPQVYEFDHSISYTAEQYLGLLNTFWDDSNNSSQRSRVLEETAKLIDLMGGVIEYPYTAVLYVLFRR